LSGTVANLHNEWHQDCINFALPIHFTITMHGYMLVKTAASVMDARSPVSESRLMYHVHNVILHIYILREGQKEAFYHYVIIVSLHAAARMCRVIAHLRSRTHTQIIIVCATRKCNDKLKKDTRFWLSERASARCWWPLSPSLAFGHQKGILQYACVYVGAAWDFRFSMEDAGCLLTTDRGFVKRHL